MNYWIFTVTQHKTDAGILSAEEILKIRLQDKFWGLGEKTPNRRSLKKEDKVVFYVGIPSMTFSVSAVLATDSFSLSDEQKKKYGHDKSFFSSDYGVLLEEIDLWSTPKRVKDIIQSLSFIENSENWGAYFQGGVRQLSEEDYWKIIQGESIVHESRAGNSIIVSEAQFALEAHLEEFMDKNWNHINFGAKLERYKIDDQNGRQFPAGQWSIDFLCIDKTTEEFVVIELKRGKTSDSTVGQILRYIGWVNENLSKSGQSARGIIIAQDVDDALKYAVRSLSNVNVMTYKVDFNLTAFSK